MAGISHSEERYRALFEGVPVGLYLHGPEGEILDGNAALVQLLGYPDLASLLSVNIESFCIDAEDRQRWRLRLEREGVGRHFEVRVRTRDGREIWVRNNGRAIRGSDGQIEAYEGSLEDITERRRAEEALRQNLVLMRSVIEGTTDLVFVKDLDGRYLMVNSADAALIGKPVDEIIGHTDQELLPAKAAETIRERELEIIAEGRTSTYEETLAVSGKTRMFLSSKGVYRDQKGNVAGIFGISRDITQARQLELQLRQAQKMEAVGRLAGGIAHDFNNVLSAILSYADLLTDDLAPNDPRRLEVEEITRAAHRAAGLTRQLLAFSRSQVQVLKVLDLNEIVEGMDKMLRRIIGEDIDLETRLSPELGHVKADAGQMEQVVMNLAVNARDAMPKGGRLTIETKSAVFDEEYRTVHEVVAPGNYVMLAVSDTGCGMSRDEQGRIFEPFYTTKEPGKGTGLGLSTVYGIVKQSAGFIWVYSEPDQGAIFKVYLPRVNAAVDITPPSPPLPEPTRGRETILLVEDEAPLRKVVHQILVRQGYTVLAANGGEEALALAQAHSGAIDLIATDLVMPGLGGRELVERLLAGHPEAGVLFMSGYTDDAAVHHRILERGTCFLQKPFSAAVLARKVREVLDGSRIS